MPRPVRIYIQIIKHKLDIMFTNKSGLILKVPPVKLAIYVM